MILNKKYMLAFLIKKYMLAFLLRFQCLPHHTHNPDKEVLLYCLTLGISFKELVLDLKFLKFFYHYAGTTVNKDLVKKLSE